MKSRSFLRKSRGIHLAETKPPTGFCKNTLSGNPEEQKIAKTAFRGTPTSRKQRKTRFGEPRRAENSENSVSGHPDEQKTAKTTFRGTPTSEKQQKLGFIHG